MKAILWIAIMLSLSLHANDDLGRCVDQDIFVWSEYKSIAVIGYAENSSGQTFSKSVLCRCAKAKAQSDIELEGYHYGSAEACRESKDGYKVLVFVTR